MFTSREIFIKYLSRWMLEKILHKLLHVTSFYSSIFMILFSNLLCLLKTVFFKPSFLLAHAITKCLKVSMHVSFEHLNELKMRYGNRSTFNILINWQYLQMKRKHLGSKSACQSYMLSFI